VSEPPNGAALSYRLARLERDHEQLEREVKAGMKELHEKLDRITLAIITGALTMSVSLIAVAVTIVAKGP
jgi:hypothetical protein